MIARLVELARHHWGLFDGWAVSHNFDPLELPPSRMLSVVYYWAVRNADEDGKQKFDRQLWRPPRGVAPPPGSPWSPEAETAAFQAFAAEYKAGGKTA